MQNNNSTSIKTESTDEGIIKITFSNPPANSMPIVLLSELAYTIEKIGQSSEVKIIILQSGGDRTFCSGADFNELLAIKDEAGGDSFFSGFAKVINACRNSPKIIIGRVQGKAVGGGVGIAAAADYCFATQQASIKLSELSIGIGPFVIAPAVERKIGFSAFSAMCLNPTEFYSAEWANQKGLFSEVFSTTQEMDERITVFSNQLATYNPEALFEMKQIFWKNTEHWDSLLSERAKISGRLILSEFTKTALNTFRS
ncbi:methylglutaconyl-CoA hydratase [Pseudarcicella hirudinis]|uniref:Methylglutaconyl-CoA hydratase n=1 Tax=Pseudarcicella hirudinis TaxID=1079859 RepID=A0A1I5QLB7_9BACT|nr:enoyl-CoA hydratase/isomerase family protein [Pseudarcicella hirudinis]SFP46880.1 methylglutaconyl-CoA hydratase [Pseudarcicella hirudinis]